MVCVCGVWCVCYKKLMPLGMGVVSVWCVWCAVCVVCVR